MTTKKITLTLTINEDIATYIEKKEDIQEFIQKTLYKEAYARKVAEMDAPYRTFYDGWVKSLIKEITALYAEVTLDIGTILHDAREEGRFDAEAVGDKIEVLGPLSWDVLDGYDLTKDERAAVYAFASFVSGDGWLADFMSKLLKELHATQTQMRRKLPNLGS